MSTREADRRVAATPTPASTALSSITVGGAALSADITEQVLSASISDTIDAATELTVAVNDPGWDVLTSGLFSPRTPVTWGQQRLVVAAVRAYGGDAGAGAAEIQCRPSAIQQLEDKRGPKLFTKLDPAGAVRNLCATVGVKVVAQPIGGTRTNVSVKGPSDAEPGETYWAAIQRWAQEAGAVVFESWGTVYWGRPSWIATQIVAAPVVWAWEDTVDDLLDVPECRRTIDVLTEPATVTLSMHPRLAATYRAGAGVAFSGVSGFDGNYWVTSVQGPLGTNTEPWTVDLAVPVDPKPDGETAVEKTAGKKTAKSKRPGKKNEKTAVVENVKVLSQKVATVNGQFVTVK